MTGVEAIFIGLSRVPRFGISVTEVIVADECCIISKRQGQGVYEERRLNSFEICCHRRILRIAKACNEEIIAKKQEE